MNKTKCNIRSASVCHRLLTVLPHVALFQEIL